MAPVVGHRLLHGRGTKHWKGWGGACDVPCKLHTCWMLRNGMVGMGVASRVSPRIIVFFFTVPMAEVHRISL